MKRQQKITPAIATSIEIQQALLQMGVELTPDLWRVILDRLEADPQVNTRRLLKFNGYQLHGE